MHKFVRSLTNRRPYQQLEISQLSSRVHRTRPTPVTNYSYVCLRVVMTWAAILYHASRRLPVFLWFHNKQENAIQIDFLHRTRLWTPVTPDGHGYWGIHGGSIISEANQSLIMNVASPAPDAHVFNVGVVKMC